MNNQDTPASANEWSEFLSTQTLSTNPYVGKLVLKSINESKLPYKKIAEQVNQDPIYSYYIMSKANQSSDKNATYSKTLDHAISMLGIEELKKVTLSLLTHKAKPDSIQQRYYARAVSSSLLAASLARKLAENKQPSQSNDIYWGALFCGVPMWYLCRFATPEMKRVRQATQTRFILPKQAEQEVLGCSIPELTIKLAKRLSLPPLTREAYSPDNQLTPRQWIKMSQHVTASGTPIKVDDKQINLISSQPSFTIALANLLAFYSSQDWYSRSTLRVQKIISVYLGIPLQQAITLTHESAVEASREHPFPGILLPAARLLLPPRKRSKANIQEQEVQQSKTAQQAMAQTTEATSTQKVNQAVEHLGEKTAKQGLIKPAEIKIKKASQPETPMAVPTPAHSIRGDKSIFTEFTDIMLKNPDNFVDLHELMNAATQCIAYGLGLPKAIVALVNTNETRLKSYYNVGTRNHPQLSNYQADLTKPSLFSRLMEKPSSIWVKPTSNKNIWAMIPPEFKVASGAREFFLMSIFVNQKPVAVFYADSDSENEPLTDYDYKQFKYMCSAATHCLQYLAEKRTKKT